MRCPHTTLIAQKLSSHVMLTLWYVNLMQCENGKWYNENTTKMLLNSAGDSFENSSTKFYCITLWCHCFLIRLLKPPGGSFSTSQSPQRFFDVFLYVLGRWAVHQWKGHLHLYWNVSVDIWGRRGNPRYVLVTQHSTVNVLVMLATSKHVTGTPRPPSAKQYCRTTIYKHVDI